MLARANGDYIPVTFVEEALPGQQVPSKGQHISDKELAYMLENYYELRVGTRKTPTWVKRNSKNSRWILR